MVKKKDQNRSLFRRLDFFAQFFCGEMMFLELFCDVLHNDKTSTWQCCCGVNGFSATICRQYVRRDMPLTINSTNISKS